MKSITALLVLCIASCGSSKKDPELGTPTPDDTEEVKAPAKPAVAKKVVSCAAMASDHASEGTEDERDPTDAVCAGAYECDDGSEVDVGCWPKEGDASVMVCKCGEEKPTFEHAGDCASMDLAVINAKCDLPVTFSLE